MGRLVRALLVAAALAGPAGAQDHGSVAERALAEVILPGTARFAAETAALAEAAPAECAAVDAEALRARVHAAWDAWMAIQHLRFGPLEEENRALQVAFWPDGRGSVGRTVERMLAARDPVVDDPAGFAALSVAGRGFPALERLLWDEAGPVALADPYRCRYVAAVARDLARLGAEIGARWRDPWAGLVRSAGAPGNAVFLAPEEVTQRLVATLLGAVGETARGRLGEPLGTFERPRPRLAEAWRSGRSLRHVGLVAAGAERMAVDVFGPALAAEDREAILTALGRVWQTLERVEETGPLPDAILAARIRVEALMQAVGQLAERLAAAGGGLGVGQGFNAADGD